MPNISTYIFGPMVDKSGKAQPFSRADVLTGVILMGALMVFVILLYQWLTLHEPLDHHAKLVSGTITALILIFHRMRLTWLSATLAFMSFRFALSAISTEGHRPTSLGLMAVCASGAYLCLRKSTEHEY